MERIWQTQGTSWQIRFRSSGKRHAKGETDRECNAMSTAKRRSACSDTASCIFWGRCSHHLLLVYISKGEICIVFFGPQTTAWFWDNMALQPIPITSDSACEIEQELYKCTYMLRTDHFQATFGLFPGSKLPVLSNSPVDMHTDWICFYGRPWERSTNALSMFDRLWKSRIQHFETHPPRPDEFSEHEVLAMETAAHIYRARASAEPDDSRRLDLFDLAYRIYVGVCLAIGHKSATSVVSQIKGIRHKMTLFLPAPDIHRCSPAARRVISHSFAGMAVCALMGRQQSPLHLACITSAAVNWEPYRPLELAGILRALLLMTGKFRLNLSSMHEPRDILTVYFKMTDVILVPLALEAERALVFPADRWDAVLSGAIALNRRVQDKTAGAIPLPEPGCSIRTHVLNGQIIERRCAQCGVWDRTGKTFSHCSGCRLVYYCGKECQRLHWREAHKAVCTKRI